MIGRLMTVIWFFKRPYYWAHALELARRKLRKNYDSEVYVNEATQWAEDRVKNVKEAMLSIGLETKFTKIPELHIKQGERLLPRARTKLGGSGDLDLIYCIVTSLKAKKVLETGVAYGWSSLAILSAQQDLEDPILVSVDMPYPKLGNENDVGIVVPAHLKKNWQLLRVPDRNGLHKAISLLAGEIDVAHYDSDKSFWGRKFAFPIIWDSLKLGGVLISDDIQDNMAFAQFALEVDCDFSVTKSDGKYIGCIRKTKI